MERLRELRRWRFRHFADVIARNGGTEDRERLGAVFAEFERRYAEAHRGHHTNKHVVEFLGLLEFFADALEDFDALWLAAEGHDVVYDLPRAGAPRMVNENRSIVLTANGLDHLGAAPEFIDRVVRFIDVSKAGVERVSDDEHFFHDGDYWIVGSDPIRYQEYQAGIRKESRGDEYPELYARGRSAFLEGTLAAGRIFDTEVFHAAFQEQAERNIRQELIELQRA